MLVDELINVCTFDGMFGSSICGTTARAGPNHMVHWMSGGDEERKGGGDELMSGG